MIITNAILITWGSTNQVLSDQAVLIEDGKVLMDDRKLTTLDEDEIKARSREIVPEFWERYEKLVPNDHVLG